MSTPFYNLFQNFVISVSTRNYIFILKRLSTNIDFIQCLLTNKQSLRTTVQLLQYKDLSGATPNFKILQTFFYISLYGISFYSSYYILYLLIILIFISTYYITPYIVYILYKATIFFFSYYKQKQRHPNGWRCLIRICVPQSGSRVQGPS